MVDRQLETLGADIRKIRQFRKTSACSWIHCQCWDRALATSCG